MPKPKDDFSFTFNRGTAQPNATPDSAPSPSTPIQHNQFRILVLADLSGRTNRSLSSPADIASRKIRAIDTDNLNSVLAALKPQLLLPVGTSAAIPLSFSSLDDFRPDALINQVPALQSMLNLRNLLKNPKTFPEAAATVRTLLCTSASTPAQPASSPPDTASSPFEQLLNQPLPATPQKNPAQSAADSLISSIVAGFTVPDADPDQATLVQLIEDALSAGIRAILRHPAYQSLESAWRSLEFLTSRLDTDGDLKLNILDLSKEELAADLTAAPALPNAGLYQLLVEQTRAPGVIPFSLVIADYTFDQAPENITLLAKIAAVVQQAQIPFIAGASPKLAGWPSFATFTDSGKWQPPSDLELWEKLRHHTLATHLALAAPRFLLRLPYGPKTDSIESFPFTEIPAAPQTDHYLWANGSFAVALLIAQSFLENGWDNITSFGNDVSDLPCHMALVDGDKEMTPCAQAFLPDRVGEILHSLGLIPLLSVKNAPSLKVAGIHSLQKSKPLAAFWNP